MDECIQNIAHLLEQYSDRLTLYSILTIDEIVTICPLFDCFIDGKNSFKILTGPI